VPLSVFFARKFCLPESLFLNKNSNQSLFLDENSNQIDSLILNLIVLIFMQWLFHWMGGGGGG
jgi:hypothetical protein